MKLLSVTPVTTTVVTGRLSDGSDREVAAVTHHVAVVLDGDGQRRELVFAAAPADADILAAVAPGRDLVPTRKVDYEELMNSKYLVWWRWKQTRLEAQARSVAANVVTALTTRENAAWTDYLAAINSWRTAA